MFIVFNGNYDKHIQSGLFTQKVSQFSTMSWLAVVGNLSNSSFAFQNTWITALITQHVM